MLTSGSDGGDVDDAAIAGCGHPGEDGASHAESGVQRDSDLVLPFGKRGFKQRLAGAGTAGLRHARVIHQNIHAAQTREDGIHEALDFGFDGEVCDEREHAFAGSLEFAGPKVNTVGGGSEDHEDPGGVKAARHGEADSFGAAGTGDDGGLLVERKGHRFV